jgi:hypothetical protein
VALTRSVDSRPPRCEAPSLKLGVASQLVSSPSHGVKAATLEGCTMSPTKVTFCQVRVRAARLMLALVPMSESMSTTVPGGGEGGGGEGGGGVGGGSGSGEGGGGEGGGGSTGGGISSTCTLETPRMLVCCAVLGGYLRVFPLQYRALKYHLLQNESSDTKKKKRGKKWGVWGVPPHSQALGASLSDDTTQRSPATPSLATERGVFTVNKDRRSPTELSSPSKCPRPHERQGGCGRAAQ